MIKGIESKAHSTLATAVNAGMNAGGVSIEKIRKNALMADIKLLRHHQRLGHMTELEINRSNNTIALLTKELDGLNQSRRFDDRGEFKRTENKKSY